MGGHVHSAAYVTRTIMRFLAEYQNVRCLGSLETSETKLARRLLADGKVNTVVLDPWHYAWSHDYSSEFDPASFIAEVRDRYPTVIFILSIMSAPVPDEWLPEWF